MKIRFKIVGVQFALAPDHVKDTPMTPEEQQRTVDFLTQLDRKKPRVTIQPEPTNENDPDAFVVRWVSRKVGYLRYREDCKAQAHTILKASGRVFFHARVDEVCISPSGYFYATAETEATSMLLVTREDKWQMWTPKLPLYPMTEEMMCVDDAVMMMQELLAEEGESKADLEELQEYTKVLMEIGRNAIWREAKEGLENIVKILESREGDEMRQMANDIERLLTGMCNDHRIAERRKEWLPKMKANAEAERTWREWRCMKGNDIGEMDTLDMILYLMETEKELTQNPALAFCSIEDETSLLSRAYYTDIPLDKLRCLLAIFVIRGRLRGVLNIPNLDAPIPTLASKLQLRLISSILQYCQTLKTREEVEVFQMFIYRKMPCLPLNMKKEVDEMTLRFLPDGEVKNLNVFKSGSVNVNTGGTLMGSVKLND